MLWSAFGLVSSVAGAAAAAAVTFMVVDGTNPDSYATLWLIIAVPLGYLIGGAVGIGLAGFVLRTGKTWRRGAPMLFALLGVISPWLIFRVAEILNAIM